MTPGAIRVDRAGKAYREYASEWGRAASWFGVPVAPRAEHWVLRDVSFAVEPGEAVGIVGPNGAGKSTLLKLITGTLRPSEGTVRAQGRIAGILELGMGFNPEFSGRQNAFRAAGLMGHTYADIAAAMPAIEAFASVGEYFDQPIRTCSSGMQMRIAFAVATAFRPDVLLVDEALAVGDAAFKARCYDRIAEFRATGSTLLLVSHSMEEVVKHCDRGILVHQGRLAKDGPARDIANRYLELLAPSAVRDGARARVDLSSSVERYHERAGYRGDEHRFGSGDARILDFALRARGRDYPAIVDADEQVAIRMSVAFGRAVERPVYGLLVKTLDGVFLYGTNSELSNAGTPVAGVEAGAVVECEFALPMALNSGDYLVSLGVSERSEGGELAPLDRRYDSIIVKVVHPRGFWGLADLRATFRLAGRADGTSAAVAPAGVDAPHA